MRSKTYRAAGVFFAGFLSLFAVPAAAGPDSWGVLAPGLPERVSVADEGTNVSFYILKQTHEPLFRREDGENYTSRILRKWSRSLDYRNFSFCPSPALEFSPGLSFSFEDFVAHVSSFTSGYAARVSIVEDGGCLEIAFETPQKDYLNFWTLYARAPTKHAGGRYELGLGPFYVESISKEGIALARKKEARGAYNRIVLHDYRGAGDPNLGNREIKDFNLINTDVVPGWVKKSFQSFDNPEMKSLILLINHPDPAVRARVYNCIDIPALRSAFYSGKTDFYDIATVLPMGVPGAVPGLPVQDCGAKGGAGKRLSFANWLAGNKEPMERFAADFQKKSGLKLQLEQYSRSEFAQAFYRRPKPFDLAVIMIYVDSFPVDSFGMFFRNGETYDFNVDSLAGKYRELEKFPGSRTATEAFRELSSEVARHALALPISQSRRTLYYPKEIKNLHVGRGILEYPEVAEFRR